MYVNFLGRIRLKDGDVVAEAMDHYVLHNQQLEQKIEWQFGQFEAVTFGFRGDQLTMLIIYPDGEPLELECELEEDEAFMLKFK